MPAARTPRGPRWTGRRLAWALELAYGRTARGGLNTRAAADGLGLSQRTIQRLLAEPRRHVPPAARRELVSHNVLPSEQTLLKEDQAAEYAREAIARIALPHGAGILPTWRAQNWLEPHLVAILEVPGVPAYGLRQIATGRLAGRPVADLRRRGQMVDFTTVPTRFHATLLVHAVLTTVLPWRIHPRGLTLSAGPTRAFAGDAPQLDLDAVAAAHGLR